jgi:hypothetical protein
VGLVCCLPSATVAVWMMVARPIAAHAGCHARERQSFQSEARQGMPPALWKIKPAERPHASWYSRRSARSTESNGIDRLDRSCSGNARL